MKEELQARVSLREESAWRATEYGLAELAELSRAVVALDMRLAAGEVSPSWAARERERLEDQTVAWLGWRLSALDFEHQVACTWAQGVLENFKNGR